MAPSSMWMHHLLTPSLESASFHFEQLGRSFLTMKQQGCCPEKRHVLPLLCKDVKMSTEMSHLRPHWPPYCGFEAGPRLRELARSTQEQFLHLVNYSTNCYVPSHVPTRPLGIRVCFMRLQICKIQFLPEEDDISSSLLTIMEGDWGTSF